MLTTGTLIELPILRDKSHQSISCEVSSIVCGFMLALWAMGACSNM